MKKVILFTFIFLSISATVSAQKKQVEWKSFDDLAKSFAIEPRPILVYISQPGCSWCRKLENETFRDNALSSYVNEKFYAVQMSVSSRAEFNFNGKIYKYDTRQGAHELAVYLTYGRMTFPHTILLASPNSQPAPFSGYMPAKNMETPLKYFGEKVEEGYVQFHKGLKKEW